jgi:pimeloyl-ACP methyl ester carboxylesterase
VIEAQPAGPWTDADAGTGRAGAWFAAFHQIPDLPEHMVRGRERLYLEWFYHAYSATPDVPDRHAVDEYLRTYARAGVMASAFARYRGIEREIAHNTRYAEPPLTVPVLAVGGQRVMGAAVADNLRHAAPHLESVVLDGCGHYVSEERPHELAEHLLRFFEQTPSPSSPGPPSRRERMRRSWSSPLMERLCRCSAVFTSRCS